MAFYLLENDNTFPKAQGKLEMSKKVAVETEVVAPAMRLYDSVALVYSDEKICVCMCFL